MEIYTKNDGIIFKDFAFITFKGKTYIPDYLIKLPLENDKPLNTDNCDCVYFIANPLNPSIRKYVGAKHFGFSNRNEKLYESINGYNPEYILCFTETKFPLDEFIEHYDFKPYIPKGI